MSALTDWQQICKPEHRGLSAKQLAALDPAHAAKHAAFIAERKDELVKELSDRLMSR